MYHSYICTVVQQELGTCIMSTETSFMQGRDSVHGECVQVEALQEDKRMIRVSIRHMSLYHKYQDRGGFRLPER